MQWLRFLSLIYNRLNAMGFNITPPDATFYIWVNCSSNARISDALVEHLPEKIHSGLAFFEACLEERVIVVPGKCLYVLI